MSDEWDKRNSSKVGEKGQLALAFVVSYGLEAVLGLVVLVAFALPVANAWAGAWSLKLLVFPVLVSAAAWYVMPKGDAVKVPGRRISRGDQPELHALVAKVAADVGVEPPTDIHLSSDMSVQLHCTGGALGSDSPTALVIGLPTLAILDRQELQALMAHEFGHFALGDRGLAQAFYARRTELARLVDHAGDRFNVASAFATFYLRRVEDLAEVQEQEADDVAVTLTSPAVLGSAVLKIQAIEPLFERYRTEVFEPMITDLRRLPFLEAFRQYLQVHGPTTLGPITERVLKRGEADRFDAHQPLWARLSRLGLDPVPGLMSWQAPPTIGLIDRLDKTEREVLTLTLGAAVEVSQKLSLSGYDQHRLAVWREAASAGPELAPLVARQGLPRTLEDWAQFGRMVEIPKAVSAGAVEDGEDRSLEHVAGAFPELSDAKELRDAAARRLAVEMIVLAEALGWQLHAPIGAGVSMADADGHQLWPFELMARVAEGENVELAEGWFRYLVQRAMVQLGHEMPG